MKAVAEVGASVCPLSVAGLLLAAASYLRDLDLPHPSVDQILDATGASRSRAYELCDDLRALLPSLQRTVGRPPTPPREAHTSAAYELRGAVHTHVLDHQGCVGGSPARRCYSDTYRHFVVELYEQQTDMEIEHFANAIMVPLGTLKDWLRASADVPADESANGAAGDEASTTDTTPASAQVRAVLSCWETWHGSFGNFCKHLRNEQRIDFGPGLISDILFAHGKRTPKRRAGRARAARLLPDLLRRRAVGRSPSPSTAPASTSTSSSMSTPTRAASSACRSETRKTAPR